LTLIDFILQILPEKKIGKSNPGILEAKEIQTVFQSTDLGNGNQANRVQSGQSVREHHLADTKAFLALHSWIFLAKLFRLVNLDMSQ
jgi:hypothetical protein